MTVFVGRLRERDRLRSALEDRRARLLVVHGPSGVGKTALIERVLGDLAEAAPIVGRAKYAEQATSAGLRPLVDALSLAVDSALGRLYDPAAGAVSLHALVGAQYDTLVAAGFTIAGLAASTTSSAILSLQSREGTVRLIEALVRVLQWLEGFALPVVIFIDDWQRAPNEATGFVHAFARRDDASQLKLILATRNDRSTPWAERAAVIGLEPLDAPDQLALLTGLLDRHSDGPAKARAILDWLGDHKSGLPFDLTEIALALQAGQAFAGHDGSLRIDATRAATIDHRDINTIIVQRARDLPADVLRLGVAAALWGDRAPLDILGRCLAANAASLQATAETLETHGLLRLEGHEVTFLHDRIRASLLSVLDAPALADMAHAMADMLLRDGETAHRQTALRLKLLGGAERRQGQHLAVLFAAAAEAARRATQFDLAAEFGEAAWSILQHLAELPSRDRPEERLAVLREACFAAAHRRDLEATRRRSALMIAAASNKAELADSYERGVVAMRLAGTSADAWALCREGYSRFGIHLPDRVTDLHLGVAALAWKLVGRKARHLIRQDARTEDAITSFANSTGYTAWERGPRLSAYKSMQVATRARLMGNDSALWLSVDAMISAVRGDFRAAAELGDGALAGLGELKSGRGMTVHRAVHFGKIWRDPRASLIDFNRLIYDHCIAENDLIGAANAVLNGALMTWRSAPTLEEVALKLDKADGLAERLADGRVRGEIALVAELVRRLRQPIPLSARQLDDFIQGKVVDVPSTAVEFLSLAEDWLAILRLADTFRGKRDLLDSNPNGVSWRFYENLARLKTGLPPRRPDMQFIARAALVNPTDQLGKLLLLRAERLHRDRRGSLRAYAEAVDAMKKGSSQLELGLAAECAMAAARDLGDSAAQERFRAIAAETWSSWGAFGKLATYKTEQLDASVQARLAEAEAGAAMARRGERAKSRFLAEIGHELRTPLQAMQGLIDLAAERPGEIDLSQMREVFGSLKSVVDDLTELGALGAEAPLNLRATDLAALLVSEFALVQESARQKDLTLVADVAVLKGRWFAVDPDRLRQSIRNLLSNAVKYTERGSVTLRASLEDETRITLAVEDTGPGIPEERLAQIFEPFDRAGRRDSKGLGLGLSLSRRIAQRMGGSLTAANRHGGGARFVLSLGAERTNAPLEASTTPLAGTRTLSILIVEDTPLVRRLMARLLTLDGHDVAEAESLAQALDLSRHKRFDLVLLDLHLPDGDGLSLLQRWPADRRRPPVIVATAGVTREVESRVARAGATVLRKPIAAADLRTAIAGICGDAETALSATGFDMEMARLTEDAQKEIARRASELGELVRAGRPREEIQRLAHTLSGLAAQFGAQQVAEAVDQVDRACAAGLPPDDGLTRLERALELDVPR